MALSIPELEKELERAQRDLGAVPPDIPSIYTLIGEKRMRELVAYRAIKQRVFEVSRKIAELKAGPQGPEAA